MNITSTFIKDIATRVFGVQSWQGRTVADFKVNIVPPRCVLNYQWTRRFREYTGPNRSSFNLSSLGVANVVGGI